MVSPNDPTLVVPSKPCQSAQIRKKTSEIYISDWICKNAAKDSPFSLYDFTKLLGRFQAM